MPFHRGKERLIGVAEALATRSDPIVTTWADEGVRMQLDLRSYVEREIYYWGFYRRWLLPHFLALLEPFRAVLDVGANVGQYALVAAQRMGSGARVIAFEPEPGVYRKLLRNIDLNGLANRIVAENAAVGQRDGTVTLHCSDSAAFNQAQSSIALLHDDHRRAEVVRCVGLDSYCATQAVTGVGILKIDAQGAEMQVLAGCARTIRRDAPHVLVRCHRRFEAALGSSPAAIQRFLLDSGYRVFEIRRWGEAVPVRRVQEVEEAVFLARHPRRDGRVTS